MHISPLFNGVSFSIQFVVSQRFFFFVFLTSAAPCLLRRGKGKKLGGKLQSWLLHCLYSSYRKVEERDVTVTYCTVDIEILNWIQKEQDLSSHYYLIVPTVFKTG